MPKISCAVILGPSSIISSQFTLEMCAAAKNCENIVKNPLGLQNRSRSSMLTKLKSPWPVLVIISNRFVPICSRFHT